MDVDKLVGRLVRRAREDRGLSLRSLAGELEKLGSPYDWRKLHRIEQGQAVTVREWLELSAALAYPPLLLVLPLGIEESVDVTPKVTVHPDLVARWIEGDETLVNSDRVRMREREWRAAVRRLRAWQGARRPSQQAAHALVTLRSAEYTGDAQQVRNARTAFVALGRELYEASQRILDLGDRPPQQPPSLIDALQGAGIDLAEVGVEPMEDNDE